MASQPGCPRKESGNRQGGWISAQAPVLPLRSVEGGEKVAGRHTGHPVPRATAAMGHQELPSGDTWPLGACPRLRLIFRAHLHGGWSTLGRAGCSPLTKRNLAQSSCPRPCRHATLPSSGLHTGKQPARTPAALGMNRPHHAGKASSGLSAGPPLPPRKACLSTPRHTQTLSLEGAARRSVLPRILGETGPKKETRKQDRAGGGVSLPLAGMLGRTLSLGLSQPEHRPSPAERFLCVCVCVCARAHVCFSNTKLSIHCLLAAEGLVHHPCRQAARPTSKAAGEALTSCCTRPLRFKSGWPRKWPWGFEAEERFLSGWEGRPLGSVKRRRHCGHQTCVGQRPGD